MKLGKAYAVGYSVKALDIDMVVEEQVWLAKWCTLLTFFSHPESRLPGSHPPRPRHQTFRAGSKRKAEVGALFHDPKRQSLL